MSSALPVLTATRHHRALSLDLKAIFAPIPCSGGAADLKGIRIGLGAGRGMWKPVPATYGHYRRSKEERWFVSTVAHQNWDWAIRALMVASSAIYQPKMHT